MRKTFTLQKIPSREIKRNPGQDRKYLQTMYFIREFYPDDTKDTYDLTIRTIVP